MNKRLDPQVRKEQLIEVALDCAERIGFMSVTRREIAQAANVSDALISAYWGTMGQLRRSIMRHAILRHRTKIIAQGLIVNDPQARKAPDSLKRAAVNNIAL